MTPVKLYIDHKQISAKSPSLSKDIIEFATKLSYFCKEGYKLHDRKSIAIFGDRLKKNKDFTDLEELARELNSCKEFQNIVCLPYHDLSIFLENSFLQFALQVRKFIRNSVTASNNGIEDQMQHNFFSFSREEIIDVIYSSITYSPALKNTLSADEFYNLKKLNNDQLLDIYYRFAQLSAQKENPYFGAMIYEAEEVHWEYELTQNIYNDNIEISPSDLLKLLQNGYKTQNTCCTELAILSFVRCFYDKTIPEELRKQFQVFAIGKNLAHCIMAMRSEEQDFVCDLWLDYLENPSNKIEFSYQNIVYPLETFTEIVCERILLLQDPQLIPLFKVVESIKKSKFKIIEQLECNKSNKNNEKFYPELINLLIFTILDPKADKVELEYLVSALNKGEFKRANDLIPEIRAKQIIQALILALY